MPNVRFLQVSDLHFGPLSPAGLPVVPPLMRWGPFTGWLGHDPRAARSIARFVRQLRRDPAPLHVVTTGDLTARGDPSQFAMAEGFLGGRISDSPNSKDRPYGLEEADWHSHSIPGNHDHWKGDLGFGTVWGFPHMIFPETARFRQLFSPLPLWSSVVESPGLPAVRFIRIDTDRDDNTYERFFARGSFLSQIKTLDQSLPTKPPGEVRVLLAHHCREYRDPKRLGRVEMTPSSRSALDAAVVRHGVDVLLSGHTHALHVARTSITDGVSSRDVLYARCGTSAQVDPHHARFRRGSDWKDPVRFPQRVEHSVVLHELMDNGAGPVWRAEAFTLDTMKRFVPADSRAPLRSQVGAVVVL